MSGRPSDDSTIHTGGEQVSLRKFPPKHSNGARFRGNSAYIGAFAESGKRLLIKGLSSAREMCLAAVWLAIALTLLSGSWASAQSVYGSLTGTVTDPNGAVLVGARVTVKGTTTGVEQTTVTNSSGIYRFGNLLPAAYNVTVSATGFGTQTTPNVAVVVNGIAELNVQLQLGTSSQTVTVSTAVPLMQTETADVQSNITSKQIENLPIMGTEGSNFQSLLREIPGAGLTSETNSNAGNPQRAINTNINGQSYQSIDTRIDGVPDLYPYLPANVSYVPPFDAIQTMNVVTNSFTAQQGMAGR